MKGKGEEHVQSRFRFFFFQEDVFKVDLTDSFPVETFPLIAHNLALNIFFLCLICTSESIPIELPDGIKIKFKKNNILDLTCSPLNPSFMLFNSVWINGRPK